MGKERQRRTIAGMVAALFCLLLFSGCRSGNAPVVSADYTPRAVGEKISADDVATVAVAGDLQLKVDGETGEFSVENSRTGAVWRSNPTEEQREADEIAKGNGRALLASALHIEYQDTLNNISSSASYTAVNKKDGLAVYTIEKGFRAVYTFVSEKIVIPLDVQLEEDGLHCAIPVSEIREEGESRLLTVSLLPAFGAAGTDEEGYFLVPDGSGALIEFNNGKYLYDDFSMPLYGTEQSRQVASLTYAGENALLPVFGIKKTGQAALAIISEGAAGASVEASVGGKKSAYNMAGVKFTLRSTDSYTIGTSVGVTKEVKIFQEGAIGFRTLGVTYRFLNGEAADYIGMADACRRWLSENGWLPAQAASGTPLYVRFLGGALKEKSVMGIPMEQIEKLTGFSEAATILQQLKEHGVEQLAMQMENWSQKTLQGKIDVSAAPAGELGGKASLQQLQSLCREQSIPLYLDIEFQKAAKWSSGYTTFAHAARTVSGVPADVNRYDIASQLPLDGAQEHLLSPDVFEDVFNRFFTRFRTYASAETTGLSVGSASRILFSDFTGGYNREQSAAAVTAVLEQAVSAGYRVVVVQPNAYLWAYSDGLLALPLTSSHYNIEDRDVPFLQIVLKGYLPYSTPSVNQADDPRHLFLQAVETGSSLLFTWISEEARTTQNTQYAVYGNAAAASWMDTAVAFQKQLQTLAGQISDSRITGHSRTDTLAVTTYSNGVTVCVNYGTAEAEWNGTTVPAGDYAVLP